MTNRRPYSENYKQRRRVVDGVEQKQCCFCEEWKTLDQFPNKWKDKPGVQRWCKACVPFWRLTRRMDITYKEYKALGSICEICGNEVPRSGARTLPVDHNHKTRQRRGILCNSCNLGIGHLGDDPERLEAAAEYLRRYDS